MRVYSGGELAGKLDEIVAARTATVTFAEGIVAGDAAAAMMFSDWAVLGPQGSIVVDTPAAWAGAVWRVGEEAMKLVAGRSQWGAGALADAVGAGAAAGEAAAAPQNRFLAGEALRLGLCDAVGEVADFLGSRSEVALDAAAALVSGRGGDALERATFAWLFATGTPAEGLGAFLEKRRPRFAATE